MGDDDLTPGFVDMNFSASTLWRGRWIILAGLLIGLALASAFAFLQPNTHRSWSTVLVKPVGIDLTRGGTGSIDPVAEREIAKSFVVAERAAARIGIIDAPADDGEALSSSEVEKVRALRRGIAVRIIQNSPVLEFNFGDVDAEYARDAAGAFAESFLEVRLEQADVAVNNAITTLANREAEVQAQLNEVNLDLNEIEVDTAEFRAAINTQAILISQLADVGTDVARLEALARDPGDIIGPAQLSQSSARSRTVPIVVAGTILGGLLGILGALFFDRNARKDQLNDGELASIGLPAVGHIPRLTGGADAYASLNRSLREAMANSSAQVLAVATLADGGHPVQVATSMASTLGADHRVLLVSADFNNLLPSRQLGLANSPGLLNALTNGHSLADVRQHAAGIDVIAAGTTEAEPASVMRMVGMAHFLREARENYDYIVISAPSLLSTETSQLAAWAADSSLLVVDAADRRGSVTEAHTVLRRTGGNVIGSVVLTETGATGRP